MDRPFKNQGVLKLQPHDHACLVYESESEWRDNVIPFIIVGLQQGEKCVYGLNYRSRQYIVDCFREEGINVAAYEESGQLLILDKSVLPGECNSDRLDQIQAFYIQFLKQWLAEGYPAVRFTNESLYTLLGTESAHNMVEVNSRMNTIIFPHYPCVTLCQYDRFKTDPKVLKYAILSHPIVIKNNELYINPSSIRDERFLEITSDRWEAEHWLAVIERENREMEKLQMINHTLNKSSQPLLCFHADGSIIACNEAFYQLMGRSGERIQHLGEIEPYWHDYLTVVIQELKQRGAHRYEREWPQPDGSRVVLDMSVLAGFDDSGNVAYYYASIVDVTRQKEAEEALRKSEEKYRLIVDNAYDGISIFDSTTFISIYQNPALKEMLGYPRDTRLSNHLFEYVHPDDFILVKQKIQEGLQNGEGSLQCRLKKYNGSYIWMEINGRVMYQDSNSPYLLFICRDISRRKRMEEELIASETRLRYSEQELQQQLDYLNYLINTMSEVFVTYDLNHCVTFVNNAVYKQLGYQPEEMLGHNVIDYIVASDKERMAMYISHRLEKGEPGIFETMVKRKNGSETLVRIKSSPIKEDDTVVGVMLLLEDISEYRKIQKEMARLDQLNTVGQIAAGIGHEIRNPMTTIKGFLQILSQNEDFIHHQQYFSLMLDELERANAIISEFLALAKNKLVNLQPRNLNSIITAIFPLLQADAMLADKSIVLDLSEIPDLLLDEKEIRQLILNLVRNGLEAMQAGGKVYISTHLEEEQVVLSVQDEGNGIDQDLLDKLGTPFFTTKDNGTGLGLAICFSIVARHEASIHPYTSPNGSTFVISFKIPSLSTEQMTLPLVY
ncbi:MAG: PAS domain S-box protein [Syntrophomonadaceae bacterium]|nr:PAS domain S-box protein [Syntrophomonadaceae bacterium]